VEDEEKKKEEIEKRLRRFSEKLNLFISSRAIPESWKAELLGDDYLMRYMDRKIN